MLANIRDINSAKNTKKNIQYSEEAKRYLKIQIVVLPAKL